MSTDWTEVEALFAAAMEKAGPERAAFLDETCVGQPDLRAEVESLLRAARDHADDFLDVPALQQLVDALGSNALIGQQIGAFTLVELIGRGGMGVVYRGDRTGADFTQRAAIKLVDVSLRHPDVLHRFRAERQILAALNHPHIVALLDGGMTRLGQAYLAMEYIDGVPITTYCARERLPLTDRLTLVQSVCGAVQYAHEHGVVHRDLKPANILITADGVPKVLDFGIAKLLPVESSSESPRGTIDGDANLTEAGSLRRPLTPNYASPEQWRGLPVTTSSDIYALGVLLYELITGATPYDFAGRPLDEVFHVILEGEVTRPSAVSALPETVPYDRKLIRGDLDAIVLKAMEKDPARRYGSARELADDLERWRQGRPVLAHEPSFRYLATKVARRHRAAAAAAVVSIAALVAALGISLWQTRIAKAEQRRATARFNDARQTADALFRLEEPVGRLPGSTAVRRQIVDESLTYLERLSRDPAGDDGLRFELAQGYHRVGDIQGNPSQPNLGDRQGALTSFHRALELLAPLTSRPNASRDVLREQVRVDLSLATTTAFIGNNAEARKVTADAETICRTLVARDPADRESRRALGSAEFQLGLLNMDDGTDLPHWQAANDLFAGLLAMDPSNVDSQRNVALVQKYIGAHYELLDDSAQSLSHNLQAKALDEARLAAHPSDRTAQFDVAMDLSNIGNAQLHTGQAKEAAHTYESSLAIRKELARTDPNDVLARSRVAFVHVKLTSIYGQLGRYAEAVSHANEAVKLSESMAGLDKVHRATFGKNLVDLGVAQTRAGNRSAGCQAFRRATEILDGIVDAKADNGDSAESLTSAAKRGLVTCSTTSASAK